ncbi:hypothetical protein A3L09_00590 [Thermococcus profundus]|uniref:DUF11 domain-containing protein n=1 Tax=Thermococcus profundus TaxID=49899 RepID=A0A2Z2MB89_THEPR|nr:hypothetical protein [Thermococcus profundus]ASJ03677.1 hypothetical protein A3L09_00590 [Thermococcus profundus]
MLKTRSGIKVLAVLLVFILIPLYLPQASAESTEKAEISPIVLGLGDSVQIANYTIQFYDVSTNWTLVTIRVSYPGGAQLLFLKEGQTGYFPSEDAEVFEVLLNSIDGENGKVTLSIDSPLRKVREDLQMTPGETVVLNKNVLVHLFSSWENGAEIGVKLPPLTELKMFNLSRGESKSFDYQLTPELMYMNYLRVELKSATRDAAVLNVYLPSLNAENLTLKEIPAGNGSKPVVEKPTVYSEVYRGYLYTGETAKIETEKGEVSIKIKGFSISSTSGIRITFNLKFSAVNGSSISKDVTLSPEHAASKVDGMPVMLATYGVDPGRGRVLIGLYAPMDSTVSIPPRPANVSVSVSAVPEKLMVGDEVAVYINVENNGWGSAHNLVIAAPVPGGFELVGNETGWSVGDLDPYSTVPAMVYVLRAATPGEFKISGITATYYMENGERAQVNSSPVTVDVYAVPELKVTVLGSNSTSNGWSSYVHAENGSSIEVLFNITALGDSPEFQYITDAVVHVNYPSDVVGPALIKLGNLKAGENIVKNLQIRTLSEGHFPIKASLTYKDPLGREHELDLGTVLVIDTVPPKVIVKKETIHVYPSEEELPRFVNETLKNSTNATGLAKSIYGVVNAYLPKETNYWKIIAVLLAVLVLVLAYLTYGYYQEVQTFRKFLLKKRKSRPGGLPKKWKKDELEVLLREIRLEVVRENLPAEGGRPSERKG